jgi:XTP/dITP diphosphohydrolase
VQAKKMRVVVATRNRGKVKEIFNLLQGAPSGTERDTRLDLDLDLVTIDEVAPHTVLLEEEDTFEGNALAKARQAAAATGLPALADDSGLEVDSLGGAPGVWSARYGGEPSNDERNNAKLLEAMQGVSSDDQRTARFRCVAAFVDPSRGIELTRAGSCEGHILSAPRGSEGFGYDPLFLEATTKRSMAELDLVTKNRLSHRAAAFRALATALAALPPHAPRIPPVTAHSA